MTQDEIIEMAEQAGLDPKLWLSTAAFEAFAKLVAKKERAEFASHAIDIVRRAIKEEREACASMAEAFHHHQYDFTGNLELHEAIRARGQA